MALTDLIEQAASMPIKITGSDDNGHESHFVNADANGSMFIALKDSSGNYITAQNNGSQRALDVGIDVAGVQVDPRSIRALTAADVVTVNQGTSPWVVSGLLSSQSYTGVINTLGGSVNASGSVFNSYIILITGSFSGALVTQKSVDGVNWVSCPCYDIAQGYIYASVVSASTVECTGGTAYFRVISQYWSSGSASVTILGSQSHPLVSVIQPSGASLQTVSKIQDSSGNSITVGQNSMSASLPVAIASNQSAIPVTGTFWPAIQPVSGTVTVNQGTSPWVVSASQSGSWTTGRTWTLASGTDSVAAIQSGTWSARMQDGTGNLLTSQVNGSQRALDVGIDVAGVQIDPRSIRALTSSDVVSAIQSGTWNIGTVATITNPVAVTGTFWPAIQPVSGTVAVTQSTSPWVVSGAVSATQSGTWNSRTQDGAGSGITSTLVSAHQSLDVAVWNTTNTKITDGTNTAKVDANLDLRTADVLDAGGVDAVVALTTTAVELKVGASIRTNRKFLMLQGLSANIVWGLSNTTQSFKIANNQYVMVPFAPGSTIWAKVTTGTGSIAVGEVS